MELTGDVPGLDPDRTPAADAVSNHNVFTAAGGGNLIDGSLEFFAQQMGSVVQAALQVFDPDIGAQFFSNGFYIDRQYGTGDYVWFAVL